MRRAGAAVRSAALAVMIGAGLWSSGGAAQDCAFPAEAEAFAVASLRIRAMVGALHCGDPDAHSAFEQRFGEQLRAADALRFEHFARTAGAAGRSAMDVWNSTAANTWAEHGIRVGPGYGADTRRLFAELAALPPGPSLVTLAERISEGVPVQVPATCRAPDDTPAPLQPR